ncbi:MULTISPECIES: hypothetical protein [Bradyrhizobium]|uniref:Uncharacterized protein n=1 Tax=Bradyrhizobium diazoefficiens TaxID=1355477 RepID=A0A809XDZ4_9BRAD|nr:hypothetical protein [Bradyrhizobium diazoefficiens]MBP1061897.1 hypothetical protein [Bradyrhizobium japonicum]QJS40754.1 hypothetical protein DI395_46800 [Bradyrhizobium diazoefficiens]QLD39495.1 hypothetical protein HUW42_06860 [Bradyrhizobium diazoefficiens]WLA75131.1 hypothetical protein QIH77_08035 [Bradyrhizobium diazoefficiens]WLB39563.1 hypothetical protein QIH78_07110 [Bradyrhizobium diazoefficiens]
MIMTQNQFLGLQARFGFRYASNRVPKTTDVELLIERLRELELSLAARELTDKHEPQ